MRAALTLLIGLSVSTDAFATWSVLAVNTKTGQMTIASATCVSQAAFEGIPSKGLLDVQAVVVPGKGVAVCQAAIDRSRITQMLVFREIQKGTVPEKILDLLKTDSSIQTRQYGILDLKGRTATFSGSGNGAVSLSAKGEVREEGIVFLVTGNILAADEVVHEAVRAFTDTKGAMTDRVIAALEAGDLRGGDRRCTCDTPPKPKAPCNGKTSQVAYILVANSKNSNGKSYNDGKYAMLINVTDQDIQPGENANPVRTLRMRYDAWKKANGNPPR